MQYIYILSKTGKISESTLEQIKNLYPKSLGKPVEILGNKKVNELPEQYGKETDEICQQECKKNNLYYYIDWTDGLIYQDLVSFLPGKLKAEVECGKCTLLHLSFFH